MDEQPRRSRGPWIALLVAGLLIAAVVLIVVLALPSRGQVDRLSRPPDSADRTVDVGGVIVLPPEQLEALVDARLEAGLSDFDDLEYLGLAVAAEPGALTVAAGARARVLGSRRLPVVARARAVVTTGVEGDALIRLDRVWIGRLPVPRALVRRVLRDTVDRADADSTLAPLAMTYDADASALRWQLPYTAGDDGAAPLPAGVSITSVGVSPTGLRLGVTLPPGLDEELRAAALALLDDREELVARARGVLGDEYSAELKSFDSSLADLARTVAEPGLRSGAAVSYAEGTAIAHVPGEDGRPIALGDRLPVGTTVETGRDGSAELALPGGHRLVVRPGTTITLDEATLVGSAGASRAHATATVGKLRAVVAELARDGEFVVDTPNGTLGVRGTDFVVSVGRSSTELSVLDGGVAVAADRAALAAAEPHAAGRAVELSGGSVDTVSQIAAGELERLLEEYPVRASQELLDSLMRPNAGAAVVSVVTRYGDLWLRLDPDVQERLSAEFERYLEANPRVASRVEEIAASLDLSRYR